MMVRPPKGPGLVRPQKVSRMARLGKVLGTGRVVVLAGRDGDVFGRRLKASGLARSGLARR